MSMCIYHTQIAMKNMTTYEDIKMIKDYKLTSGKCDNYKKQFFSENSLTATQKFSA